MSKTKLFDDFERSSAIDWKNQIIKELKEKPFESLVSKTPEGIPIQPFYHHDLLNDKSVNIPNSFQNVNEALAPRFWANQSKINVSNEKIANDEALKVLNGGAEGLIFVTTSSEIDFNILLKDIQPEYCMISFESVSPHYNLITRYLEHLEKRGIARDKISGFYHCDIIESRDAGEIGLDNSDFQHIAKLIEHADQYPDFKSLCISSELFHNSGANSVHESGLLLSKTVDFFDKLTDLKITIRQILQSTVFSIPVGRNFFFEIAKIKAFKLNLLKIAEGYESEVSADDIFIHCATSMRSKSALDFNVNMLRNTNEAMAAILGGCNSLWVRPHDEAAGKPPSATFKRIALNISNILKEEAHFDKIVDPTQGSYYLETIIDQIAEASWKLFLDFEADGSYNHHFENGRVHQLIDTDAGKAEEALWNRKDVFIGTNTFQLIGEKVGDYFETENSGKSLEAKRLTTTMEHMRYRVEKLVAQKGEEARPMAQVLLLGTDAVSKAKADFVYSFLGIAGIGIASEDIVKDLASFTSFNDKASFSILCYKDKPTDLEAFISDQSKMLLIAGKEENEESLKEKGLYACIHKNMDTKRFLDQLLQDLGIALL